MINLSGFFVTLARDIIIVEAYVKQNHASRGWEAKGGSEGLKPYVPFNDMFQ